MMPESKVSLLIQLRSFIHFLQSKLPMIAIIHKHGIAGRTENVNIQALKGCNCKV